ncbi:MAG: alpha/beta family hydrolase, partial [Vibrio sp.]
MSALINSNCLDVGAPQYRLVFAHGAGAGMQHEFMQDMTDKLLAIATARDVTLEVVRFNFPYMCLREETGSKRPPDRAPKLLADFSQQLAIHHFEKNNASQTALFLAGKSMGGRMASWLVSEEAPDYQAHQSTDLNKVCGVMCLGFPFHPPKKPENFKGAHLKTLTKPLLLLQGERDTMGTREEVQDYDLSASIQTQWLTDGDHSLKPRVRSGITEQQ